MLRRRARDGTCKRQYKNSRFVIFLRAMSCLIANGAAGTVERLWTTRSAREQGDPVKRDRREFRFIDGSSRKFWAIELDGKSFSVHFGRIGTVGRPRKRPSAPRTWPNGNTTS